jgi:hypothetical protein
MNGCMGGCVSRAFALVLLLLLVGAAWRFGPDLYQEVRGGSGEELRATEPTPELAMEAEERVAGLLEGELEEISLAAVEIESLLRFRSPVPWPEGVSPPEVGLRDDELHLGIRLSRDRLPTLPELEGILGFLPDTVPVQLRGRVLAVGGGEAALLVHRVDASAIPIPRRFFPAILERVQPQRREDLPPEALALPLPGGIESARVAGDRLILTRRP